MTIQIKNADTIKTDFIAFLRSAIEENDGPNVTDYNVGSVLNVLVEAFADVLEAISSTLVSLLNPTILPDLFGTYAM